MMKKLVQLTAIAVMVIGASACGKKNETASSAGTTSTKTAVPTLSVSCGGQVCLK